MSDKQENSEKNIHEDERIQGESKKESRGGGFGLFFGIACLAAAGAMIALAVPPILPGIAIALGLVSIFKDRGTKKDSGSAASKATPRVTVDLHPRDANGMPHNEPSTRLTKAQTDSLNKTRHPKPGRPTERKQRRQSI